MRGAAVVAGGGAITILLRNVETYTNKEGMDRQGALLFLDMETAFDRVSYEFLNKGLDLLGFGENYKKTSGHDVQRPRPPEQADLRKRVL